jgi:hypothetical protein
MAQGRIMEQRHFPLYGAVLRRVAESSQKSRRPLRLSGHRDKPLDLPHRGRFPGARHRQRGRKRRVPVHRRQPEPLRLHLPGQTPRVRCRGPAHWRGAAPRPGRQRTNRPHSESSLLRLQRIQDGVVFRQKTDSLWSLPGTVLRQELPEARCYRFAFPSQLHESSQKNR